MMSRVEVLLSMLLNGFNLYVNFRIIQVFLKKKDSTRVMTSILYIAVWLLNWICCYYYESQALTMGSMIVGIFIAELIAYSGKIIIKAVSLLSVAALGTLAEFIAATILNYMHVSYFYETFGSFLSTVLMAVFCLVIENFFKNRYIDEISSKSYYNVMIIIFGSIIIANISLTLSKNNYQMTTVIFVILSFMDISTLYLCDKVNEMYKENSRQRLFQQRMLMYENQMDILNRSQKNMSTLRHNMKRHMLLLQSYLDDEKYNEAKEYVYSVIDQSKLTKQYINTNNIEVDAVLNYMLGKAVAMSCQIEKRINIPEVQMIPPIDLNVILSNLLENALEALEYVNPDDRYLYVDIQHSQGILSIKIYNSYDGYVQKSEDKGYVTRKKEKEFHGIGLNNVSEIVEKYGGSSAITQENGMFKVNIIIHTGAVQ